MKYTAKNKGGDLMDLYKEMYDGELIKFNELLIRLTLA